MADGRLRESLPDGGHCIRGAGLHQCHLEEAITKLQEAWDSSEQKDECIVRLNDLEGAYWMGTEIGQLGATESREYRWVSTDRAKTEEWGLGAANLGRKVRANACESVERMKSRVRTDRNWER